MTTYKLLIFIATNLSRTNFINTIPIKGHQQHLLTILEDPTDLKRSQSAVVV